MPHLRTPRSARASLTVAAALFSTVLLAPAAMADDMPDLGPGDSGPDVVELQTELAAKGFFRAKVTGEYGPMTEAAVMAFRKEISAARSTSFAGALSDDLRGYPDPWLPERGEPNYLEVNLTKQVMYLVSGGEVEAIFHISSGRPGYETPVGDFELLLHREGWYGGMYNPWYYTTGLAVHGYDTVPSYPYSHGCIRVHTWDSDYLESRLFVGMPIHIWFEPDHYEHANTLAMPSGDTPDRLVSYDNGTGDLIPLQLLGLPGRSPGIVESGARSSTLPGFDFVLDGKIGATQLLILYDKAPGLFQYLEVTDFISTDVVFEKTGSRGWTHIVPGDYDGDGVVDLLFYRATDGLMRFYTVDVERALIPITPVMYGNQGWTHMVPGDYDGDGSDDVMWYRATDGLMRFYAVDAPRFVPMTPVMYGSLNWTMIPSGDFDGDGYDDVMYYRATDGIYRFYDVGPDGTFSAKSPAKFMSPGWTQIVNAKLDATLGTDLVFYRTGWVTAGRFSPDGIVSISEGTDAPPNQILVSIEGP